MSAQIHQLHSEATAAQFPNKPTEAESKVIAKYVQYLKDCGWCKKTDKTSKETHLFNRYDGEPQSLAFIDNDFPNWLDDNGLWCEFRSAPHIIRTLKHVVGSKFVPGEGEYYTSPLSKCNYVNTYRQYQPTTDSADVPPEFLEFFERFVEDEYERRNFLRWLAHMFQRPKERPSWHIMLPSIGGAGKGFLVEYILHPLLHHTQIIDSYSSLSNDHNTSLVDNLLILLDDCKANSSTQTRIKSMLTEERTYVNRKHGSAGMENTYTRFILASNEDNPLPGLEEDDRRWFVMTRLKHRHDANETQLFIKRLSDLLDEGNTLCRVYNWFMQYPLGDFNPKRPLERPPVSEDTRTLLK